jgi:hypothetical protein
MPSKIVGSVTIAPPDDEEDYAPQRPSKSGPRLLTKPAKVTRTELPNGTVLVSNGAQTSRDCYCHRHGNRGRAQLRAVRQSAARLNEYWKSGPMHAPDRPHRHSCSRSYKLLLGLSASGGRRGARYPREPAFATGQDSIRWCAPPSSLHPIAAISPPCTLAQWNASPRSLGRSRRVVEPAKNGQQATAGGRKLVCAPATRR